MDHELCPPMLGLQTTADELCPLAHADDAVPTGATVVSRGTVFRTSMSTRSGNHARCTSTAPSPWRIAFVSASWRMRYTASWIAPGGSPGGIGSTVTRGSIPACLTLREQRFEVGERGLRARLPAGAKLSEQHPHVAQRPTGGLCDRAERLRRHLGFRRCRVARTVGLRDHDGRESGRRCRACRGRCGPAPAPRPRVTQPAAARHGVRACTQHDPPQQSAHPRESERHDGDDEQQRAGRDLLPAGTCP